MGDPPPMAAYWFWILGVRRREINGPRYGCKGPSGIRSPSANRRERKSPTSPVVLGPPMFMKTIAVGPLELVESCVTGGATVAMAALDSRGGDVVRTLWDVFAGRQASWRVSRLVEVRSDMVGGGEV